MSDEIIALVGAMGGILVMILKNEFFKGRKTKMIEQNADDIKELKRNYDLMNQRSNILERESVVKEQQILQITKEHQESASVIREFSRNLAENTQAIVAVKSTMQGLKELMEAIIDGKIKIG